MSARQRYRRCRSYLSGTVASFRSIGLPRAFAFGARAGIAAVVVQLVGCAYSFHGDLPAHLTKVRVPVFRNETTLAGLEIDVTRGVIEALGADGRLRVAARDANCLLEGRLVSYRRVTLREDGLDDVIEARVALTAQITFRDLKTGKILLKRRRVTNRATDADSGIYRLWRRETEARARQQAVQDLARAIARTVTELWLDTEL